MTKLLKKKNWFTKKNDINERDKDSRGEYRGGGEESRERGRETERGEEGEPETVMFVPSTPRGELVKRLRETDKRFAGV